MSAIRASRAGRAYLLGVPVPLGLCLLAWALVDLVVNPPPPAWMALPALALLTGSFTFRIPGSVVRLTVAEPIIFTATLLYGPAAGTVAAAIDAVAMSLRMGRDLRTAHRFAFNVALLSIAIWPASQIFFHLTGIDSRHPTYPSLGVFLGPNNSLPQVSSPPTASCLRSRSQSKEAPRLSRFGASSSPGWRRAISRAHQSLPCSSSTARPLTSR